MITTELAFGGISRMDMGSYIMAWSLRLVLSLMVMLNLSNEVMRIGDGRSGIIMKLEHAARHC